MRVRRYSEVVAGLALVSVLTAASPAWGAGKTPNLKPQLLTISAMPPGWSVHSDTPPSSCVTAAINGAPGKVAAAFEDSGGAPTFTEVLLPGGANRYTSWKKSLDKCHQFKITNSSGTTVTATLAALSFPTLGQRTRRTLSPSPLMESRALKMWLWRSADRLLWVCPTATWSPST